MVSTISLLSTGCSAFFVSLVSLARRRLRPRRPQSAFARKRCRFRGPKRVAPVRSLRWFWNPGKTFCENPIRSPEGTKEEEQEAQQNKSDDGVYGDHGS